jgi:proline racemase
VIDRIRSFEYHVGGQPVRVIVDGVPAANGRTAPQKAAWFARHADRYRRSVVSAPRGHEDMTAVLLTEPSSPGAHAGLLFLDAAGYPRFAAHGVMAAATAAAQHGLIFAPDAEDGERRLIFDTPAGVVSTRVVHGDLGEETGVAVTCVPAFVHAAGVSVALATRTVPVDVAFGGEFYALVDGEAAGVPLDRAHMPELRRLGRSICAAFERTAMVSHPLDPSIDGVRGVLFTAPAHDGASHLLTVLVSASGAVDWSAGPSATPAVLAVLDAIGLLADAPDFTHEGLSGARTTARVVSRSPVGEQTGLIVEIGGRAWPTGEETWIVDHDDPFHQGLAVTAAEAV